MSETLPTEIEVICSVCSFPTVTEEDENGKLLNFREEEAPKTEEEALAAGWTDSGLGLNCPPCSAKAAEEAKLAEEQGEQTGAGPINAELREAMKAVEKTTYYGMLRELHPTASLETIGLFAGILRACEGSRRPSTPEELEKFLAFTAPKTEEQALEYLAVAETVKKAMVPR